MTAATEAIQKFEHPKAVAPTSGEFQVMKETASMLVKTGFLPQSIKTPEQAMAIILTGRELGIGMMAALNTINVIQQKPTVSPQLMLALIERSGQLENIEIEPHNGNAIRCTMKRKGRSPHTEYFGETEAAAMQLGGKDNYKKQAFTMYRWRAVAACARVAFPDVILGLYTPDEMGASVNDDGEIVPVVNEPLRIHTAARSVDNIVRTEPQTIDADVVVPTMSISDICKQLKSAGDIIDWNKATLLGYAEQLFGEEIKSLEALNDEQREFLYDDLQDRLTNLSK